MKVNFMIKVLIRFGSIIYYDKNKSLSDSLSHTTHIKSIDILSFSNIMLLLDCILTK